MPVVDGGVCTGAAGPVGPVVPPAGGVTVAGRLVIAGAGGVVAVTGAIAEGPPAPGGGPIFPGSGITPFGLFGSTM